MIREQIKELIISNEIKEKLISDLQINASIADDKALFYEDYLPE